MEFLPVLWGNQEMEERWAELERKKAKLVQIRAEKEDRRMRGRNVDKDEEILTYWGEGEEVVAMRLCDLSTKSVSLIGLEDSKTSVISKLPRTISRSTQTSPLPQRPKETQTDEIPPTIQTEIWARETSSPLEYRSCNPSYYSLTYHEDQEGW